MIFWVLSVDANGTKHVDGNILKAHWESNGRIEGRKIAIDESFIIYYDL